MTNTRSATEVLFWQASTMTMTPRIDAAELERERLADPVYFLREYEAQFTDDLSAFIPPEDVTAAIGNWRELPPTVGGYHIMALDAASLTASGDTFTVGIAHGDKSGSKVDLVRGYRRVPVNQVCDEIGALAKLYRIQKIIADQYSFVFLSALMAQRGVELAQQPFTARSKPEVFFALKNALAGGKFQIPNHPEAIKELRLLESIRSSGGGYRISAPRGLHDDFATVLALIAHKIENSHAPRKLFMPEVITVPRGLPPAPKTTDRYANLDPNDPGPANWWKPQD